ncbi:hypothetical protein B9Z19DRAFT_1157318 [Tuber borchii]|uniref:Uncharacterized protein n=1 Tax=Tuber borchii TaxID=42251 RepID=A0A2T6ZGR7_TUBBO|nr:hypothetical protein B9Z19DRAFT_1157318 [Tuber borchii]
MSTGWKFLLKGVIANKYNPLVERLRAPECPQLREITYPSHAATVCFVVALIHSFLKPSAQTCTATCTPCCADFNKPSN